MSVFKIDIKSTSEEIEDFYHLYVESFPNLCVWQGNKIIDLGEYLKPTNRIDIFFDDVEFITKGMGIIIYYTHNDDIVTSISFVEIDEPSKCYVKIKYLCGNQTTQSEKIAGKSQGKYLLDYIFTTYRDFIILIEPASPALIPYYTSFKTPCFPYNKSGLNETFNFLVYGNLTRLNENCFKKLFMSINIINKLIPILQFDSLNDLYLRTNNINELKEKLIVKLEHLIKTKQLKAEYYENLINNIISIKYYDIHDIILASNDFNSKNLTTNDRYISSSKVAMKSGGKKYKKKTKANKNKKKFTRKH
jgi:hypothetical protein